MNLLKKQNGMNIIGQGGKIILFMLPALLAAIVVHLKFPKIVAFARQPRFRPVHRAIFGCCSG